MENLGWSREERIIMEEERVVRLKRRLRYNEGRGGDLLKKVEEREGGRIVFVGVHPEIYEQGAGGEKNLAASGQPRPKYRTAPVDSETVFRLPKVVACATREKAFFPCSSAEPKIVRPLFLRIRGRVPNVSYSNLLVRTVYSRRRLFHGLERVRKKENFSRENWEINDSSFQ